MNKKTLIVITIFSLLCSINIYGQVRVGLKGGLSYSSFSSFKVGELPEAVNSHTGFNAGVAVCFHLPHGFAIQPEVLFVSKGADFTGDSNLSLKTNYVEVPVNIQAGLDLILMRPYLAITPFVGFVISHDVSLKGGSTISELSNRVNKFDYGIAIGGGIDIWRFQLSARYKWSLANLTNFNFSTGSLIPSEMRDVIDAINKGSYKGFEISIGFFF